MPLTRALQEKKGVDYKVYIQTFVTMVFAPMACLWYVTIMIDIMANTPWDQPGEVRTVLYPCACFGNRSRAAHLQALVPATG